MPRSFLVRWTGGGCAVIGRCGDTAGNGEGATLIGSSVGRDLRVDATVDGSLKVGWERGW